MLKTHLFLCCAVLLAAPSLAQKPKQMTTSVFPSLHQYLEARAQEFDQIPVERREELRDLAAFIKQEHQAGKVPMLTFICTHNSRRSHMAQLWMAAAMTYAGAGDVKTYSGGTEVTAFNPRAVKAMENAGFQIQGNASEPNCKYEVRWSGNAPASLCFSKHYAHESNPQQGFAAVMTCSQADEACPIVFGAAARIAIAYEDPKLADNTPEEAGRYAERCAQIAREMLFVAMAVKK